MWDEWHGHGDRVLGEKLADQLIEVIVSHAGVLPRGGDDVRITPD